MPHLVKTFFDLPLLVLWGDKVNDDNKRCRLTFGFRDGRPRLTVNTGVTGRDGMILFPADAPTMTAMMMYLVDIANGPNDNKMLNDSLAPVYVDNKATAEKKIRGSLIIGKTKDGIVYITVIAEGFPKIIFPFKPSDFHVFRDNNKEVIPVAQVSAKMALAYSEQVRMIIAQASFLHAQEEYDSGDRKLGSTERPGNKPSTGASQNSASNASKFQDLDDIAL